MSYAQLPSLKKLIEHKVATSVLTWVAIIAGFWGAVNISVTLLPEFEIPVITVATRWPGAGADDVASSVLKPLELSLGQLSQVDSIQGISLSGSARIIIRLDVGADQGQVLEDIKRLVASVDLPEGVAVPEITPLAFTDPVSTVILTGQADDIELRNRANQLKASMKTTGAVKVEINGLRSEAIQVAVHADRLRQYQLRIDDIIQAIKQAQATSPAGSIGDPQPKEVRLSAFGQKAYQLRKLPLWLKSGRMIWLEDVATITRGVDDQAMFIEKKGKPVIQLQNFRPTKGDSVRVGQATQRWLYQVSSKLPDGLNISMFREVWTFVYARLWLLFGNALSGLVLVIAMLSLCLGWRLSFWVVLGIPIALLLSLCVLYLSGRSLNVISSFAFILALGIIVDDAIVVGEETASQMESGVTDPYQAAYNGARRMIFPVIASSLTTIAAMLPLLILSGVWGAFMLDIPVVIVSVIAASCLECFLILPGHLAHMHYPKPGSFRKRLNHVGRMGIDRLYRPLIHWALNNRLIITTMALIILGLTLALIQLGHVAFEFYGGMDSDELAVNVTFTANTSIKQKQTFMRALEQSLEQVNAQFSKPIKANHLVYYHFKSVRSRDQLRNPYPEREASLVVSLVARDNRVVSNAAIVSAWQQIMPPMPTYVTHIDIRSTDTGPERSDLMFSLRGHDLTQLKSASRALQERLKKYRHLSNITDDMPLGSDSLQISLKPVARQLGLTKGGIGKQLMQLLTPQVVSYIYEPYQAVPLRVSLAKADKQAGFQLYQLPIDIGNAKIVSAGDLLNVTTRQGHDIILHEDGQTAINVSATVDLEQANSRSISQEVWSQDIPAVEQAYQVTVKNSMARNREQKTLNEMIWGAYLGLGLMYLILVSIFSSYMWPFAVLLALPLGLVGAVLGHWWLSLSIGLFSLFGMFTLSGVVVNDAIILLVRYRELLGRLDRHQALVEACCQRIRPVLLTSFTTILGLLPILINQSATAKYFHTTAATIIFGLMFASIWILLAIPVWLSLIESLKYGFVRLWYSR